MIRSREFHDQPVDLFLQLEIIFKIELDFSLWMWLEERNSKWVCLLMNLMLVECNL